MSDRPRKPEVLAPAGSLPSLLAALQHGADAVYFGLQDGFNARARAANFALADLPALCARIHRAGARAYVTLNTLVFEPELPALERVLRGIAAAGVDALIVQDPAVCLLARAVWEQGRHAEAEELIEAALPRLERLPARSPHQALVRARRGEIALDRGDVAASKPWIDAAWERREEHLVHGVVLPVIGRRDPIANNRAAGSVPPVDRAARAG